MLCVTQNLILPPLIWVILQNNILSFFKNKGTFYLIGLIFITTCISCQKEIVHQ